MDLEIPPANLEGETSHSCVVRYVDSEEWWTFVMTPEYIPVVDVVIEQHFLGEALADFRVCYDFWPFLPSGLGAIYFGRKTRATPEDLASTLSSTGIWGDTTSELLMRIKETEVLFAVPKAISAEVIELFGDWYVGE